MDIEDREIEYAPLTGSVTRDGLTVDVKIYRFAGTDDPWQLEVVDDKNWSTVWDDQFQTAEDAYFAFNEAVEEDGMMSFLGDSGSTVH
ncbi:hypothetical protein AFCDBAGC_5058 [Methylobacterium cerastii]|uniref:Uncharacterized protein n=1 Tax=Methylobacterium cerastii TaxID=932741 RepID=A0ABQ4QPI5_9HYPH|nr:hypothetical protein [Methylobacterium cerastii]GJD47172.1 hypothetical protein AFCDBAGC_5058 [Methylobacterium cerastii]